jgi:hypothetical protein
MPIENVMVVKRHGRRRRRSTGGEYRFLTRFRNWAPELHLLKGRARNKMKMTRWLGGSARAIANRSHTVGKKELA